MVALTISFAVCDAGQLDASRSALVSTLGRLASFQMDRPEQKAPCDLTYWRVTEDTAMTRGAASGATIAQPEFRYALEAARPWGHLFGWHLNACESPRAPPC